MLQGRRRLEKWTFNFGVELRSLFSLSIPLILCLFGSHPKKTKAIISIQFVPSPCMSTDRLSYFGHAPRGELWEAGGQINGYYLSHRLITEHLDPGARTHRHRAEGTAESVIDNRRSFILHHLPPEKKFNFRQTQLSASQPLKETVSLHTLHKVTDRFVKVEVRPWRASTSIYTGNTA